MTINSGLGESVDDGELILGIRRGDEEALRAIMTKYSSQVFSAAFQVLRQRAEAQEVTQDVFLALWRSPEKFDSKRGTFLTWLLIISRSRALDVLRRIAACAARETPLTAEILNTSRASIASFTSDDEILIEELLSLLPYRQGSAVQKIYLEGYGLAEFAMISGIPLGTIKHRVRLALQKLRSDCGLSH